MVNFYFTWTNIEPTILFIIYSIIYCTYFLSSRHRTQFIHLRFPRHFETRRPTTRAHKAGQRTLKTLTVACAERVERNSLRYSGELNKLRWIEILDEGEQLHHRTLVEHTLRKVTNKWKMSWPRLLTFCRCFFFVVFFVPEVPRF